MHTGTRATSEKHSYALPHGRMSDAPPRSCSIVRSIDPAFPGLPTYVPRLCCLMRVGYLED
jgi:hypothetical protein